MRGPASIADASASCLQSLEGCLDIEALMHGEWAERRLGDLNLWVSTTGAQAKGRASFDYRLGTKHEIHVVVSNLLNMLEFMIERCKTLAYAPLQPSTSTARSGAKGTGDASGTPVDEQEVDEFELSDFSDSATESSDDNHFPSSNEIRSQMRDIDDILRQLSQIATAVRRSGRGFRLRKADQLFRPEKYEELRLHLKTIILSNVRRWASEKTCSDLITKWRSELSLKDTWSTEIDANDLTDVQERLVYCNLMRRHRFIYQQRHSRKLDPYLEVAQSQANLPEPRRVMESKPVKFDSPSAKARLENMGATQLTKTVVTGTTDRTGTTATGISTSFDLSQGELKRTSATPSVVSRTVASKNVDYPWPPGNRQKEERNDREASSSTDDVSDGPGGSALFKKKLRLLDRVASLSTAEQEELEQILLARTGDSTSAFTDNEAESSAERLDKRLAKKMEGKISFKCPCCCQALDSELKLRIMNHKWRTHIADDLVPYTCIMPACEKPETMYATKQLWRQHLFNDHNSYVYWRCLACDKRQDFDDEEMFRLHLQEEHSGIVPSSNIEQLLYAWKNSAPAEIHTCPMCSFPENQEGEVDKEALLDHIAIELQNFALRALPWADDNDQESALRIEHSINKVSTWMDDMLAEALQSDNAPDISFDQDSKDDDTSWVHVFKPSFEPMKYRYDYFSREQNEYFGDSPASSNAGHESEDSSIKAQLKVLKEEQGDDKLGAEMKLDESPDSLTPQMSFKKQLEEPTPISFETPLEEATLEHGGSGESARRSNRKNDPDRVLVDTWGRAIIPPRGIDYEVLFGYVEGKGADYLREYKGNLDDLLLTASRRGRLQVVGILLNYGVRPNPEPSSFGNPLQAASALGFTEVVQLLLKNGADPNKRGSRNGFALEAAAAGNHIETVMALRKYGADVNAMDGEEYDTALQAASSLGHLEMVRLLIDFGADVNIGGVSNRRRHTALQAATRINNLDIVQLLIERGADVNAWSYGRHGSALQIAIDFEYTELVSRLLEFGTEVDATSLEIN